MNVFGTQNYFFVLNLPSKSLPKILPVCFGSRFSGLDISESPPLNSFPIFWT